MISEIYQLSRQFLEKYHRPYVRYFLEQHPFSNRFSIVIGERGVGKSTAMIQHLLSKASGDILSTEILYVQSDHFLVGRYALYEIAEEFVKRGGKLICFDEIHKYAGWSQELKSIYDTFTDLNIIATGSSALEIARGSHDLSRRALVRKMEGMSLREFAEMSLGIELETFGLEQILEQHETIARNVVSVLNTKGEKIVPLFDRYLRYGYYPFFWESQDENLFHLLLEQNLHTILEVDLSSVHTNLTGENIRRIKKLLAFIAGAVPFMPNFGTLKESVGVGDNRTLKTYLGYLADAGLLLLIETEGREYSAMRKPEKIYLGNTNQLFALSEKGRVNRGTVREIFFARSLSAHHKVQLPHKGDFLVDKECLFEIGGKNKTFKQIAGQRNGYLALDNIETGFGKKIPLWLFGFLH